MKIKRVLELLRQEHTVFVFQGEEEAEFSGFSDLNTATDCKMVWVRSMTPDISAMLATKTGLLILCGMDQRNTRFTGANHYIFVEEPRSVFFSVLNRLFVSSERESTVGTGAVVESRNIGASCVIGANSYIASDVEIGDFVTIGSNVSIASGTVIGNYCNILSGAVIGEDGFGFYKDKNGLNHRIPHFGKVRIGDYVEIGANTCIDRGTLGSTVIGSYTKIDNLVHIAHNVIIGRNCMIAAGARLCGSSRIGDGTYIAPGAVIRDQVTVGENSLIGMGAVVAGSVAPGCVMAGVPAKKLSDRSNLEKNH